MPVGPLVGNMRAWPLGEGSICPPCLLSEWYPFPFVMNKDSERIS